MKVYKGYEIDKVTRNTFRIRHLGGEWIDMWGHYPQTIKQAKEIIDSIKED